MQETPSGTNILCSLNALSDNKIIDLYYFNDQSRYTCLYISRQRFEATKCWVYEYDGLSPPPNSTATLSSNLSYENDEAMSFDSTNKSIKRDSTTNTKSEVHEFTGSSTSIEKSELSSTFGLTKEETREFWNMLLPTETGSGIKIKTIILIVLRDKFHTILI